MDELTFQDSIAALKHPDHSVRCKSALALGKSKDKRAVEPLIAAMTDANEFVRMDVACALGQIGDTHALEPLLHALHDVHGYVRREAALALGELGDIRAVDRLIAMLEGDQGAAAAKALFKITGEAYERILMSGKTPGIVYKQAIERKLKEEKSMLTVNIGDTNVGYRVVAVKKGSMQHLSIVLAERVSDTTPTKYVVWAFDGTGFKSGIYENDKTKAQSVFDSRTN